jgi:hypothetical protein
VCVCVCRETERRKDKKKEHLKKMTKKQTNKQTKRKDATEHESISYPKVDNFSKKENSGKVGGGKG